MSKRALKSYLNELSKQELEEQVLALYDRLKEVKEFYTFVFNPQEDKRLDEAKFKIAKEYFPPTKRKPKKRRSVGQNAVKEFIKLGVDPQKVADLMLYSIEIAQVFNAEKEIVQEAFYKSMLKTFKEALIFIDENGLEAQFSERIHKIVEQTLVQNWINKYAFELALDKRY